MAILRWMKKFVTRGRTEVAQKVFERDIFHLTLFGRFYRTSELLIFSLSYITSSVVMWQTSPSKAFWAISKYPRIVIVDLVSNPCHIYYIDFLTLKLLYVLKINLFMFHFLSYFAYFDLFQRCQIIATRSYNKPTGCQILTDLSLGYECQNNHVQTWIIYYEKFILAWKTFWEVHFVSSAILEIIIHIV